jgi:ribose transport system permease protein
MTEPVRSLAPAARERAARTIRAPEEVGIFAVLVVVALGLSLISPQFRTISNGFVLLVNGTVIAFLALGQSFVLLTGGIDLSTGANVAMSGVIAALLMKFGLPWPVASLLTLGIATLLGVINGGLTYYLRIPAFIAISIHDFGFTWVGQGRILGTPVPVVLIASLAILAGLFLKMTRLGVHIYALGGNRAAARLAGVNVATVTLFVYGVSGFCAGIGGLIATSRLMVGFPATGTGNELFYSIAAAVVGGVSLFGGVGSVLGAMIGAVLIAIVSNGMNVINVESYWQSLVIGIIILAGVTFDTFRRSRANKPAARSAVVRTASHAEAGPMTAHPMSPDRDASRPTGSA